MCCRIVARMPPVPLRQHMLFSAEKMIQVLRVLDEEAGWDGNDVEVSKAILIQVLV